MKRNTVKEIIEKEVLKALEEYKDGNNVSILLCSSNKNDGLAKAMAIALTTEDATVLINENKERLISMGIKPEEVKTVIINEYNETEKL